jgi:hypothetical protein
MNYYKKKKLTDLGRAVKAAKAAEQNLEVVEQEVVQQPEVKEDSVSQ